ncbi:MAG: hypothetical protein LBG52_08245 [Candidatus Peribacteria bacterium]|jgi:hypothetical protein|nr:hypothetical protein [Candidatus Peribacteria bacterium]
MMQLFISFLRLQMIIEWLLRIFITFYGLTGLATFNAHIPKVMKGDDEFVPGNVRDYLFWLLTAIIFFVYAIFIVSNILLSFIFSIELALFIGAFSRMVYTKKLYVVKKLKKLILKKKRFF